MSALPIPSFFNPENVGQIRRVPYEERAAQARDWAQTHGIQPASTDVFKMYLVLVDIQNTFCIPGFELFVAGTTGLAAVDDTRRVCEFIYRNLHVLTQICPTLDTHQAAQIFHSIFFVNDKGQHPAPYTLIRKQDIHNHTWRFNSHLAQSLHIDAAYGQDFLKHYTHELTRGGKYDLTIWPYHAMLGGIGHALVPAVEEAIFFHTIARYSQPNFLIKGNHPLTENYSVISPEVTTGPDGQAVAQTSDFLFNLLMHADALIFAGQAKSHCVAWTLEDLLRQIQLQDEKMAQKIYLLEDCTSPVVVPGVIDYTSQAEEAFKRFEEAGMHRVRSTERIENWPGITVK